MFKSENAVYEDIRTTFRTWHRDWGGLLTLGLTLIALSYSFWLFFIDPGDELKMLVTDIAQPVISLAMTILAWRTSRHPNLKPRKRLAWRLLAISFCAYFIGNVIWAYYELILGESPALCLADLAYLMYYPICLAGLLSFPMRRAGRSRLTFTLDAGTVMLGAAILIWYIVLRPVALAQHTSFSEAFITLAYPVLGTVLLFGVIAVLLRRPPSNAGIALRILTIAIICDAIADFGYSYQTLEQTYFGGQWPDCFYMIGFVLMGVSAQYQFRTAGHSRTPDAEPATLPFSWLPYAAVAAAYGLLLYVALVHRFAHGMEPIVWLTIGAFLITALVVARQIVALRENTRLLAEKSARESEARFGRLVQHSSDVITIMEPDGKLLYLSPSVEPVFGYEPAELVGTELISIIHPEDQQAASRAIASILEVAGKSVGIEVRVRHRSESWLHVEAVATNLSHEQHIEGIVVNSRDVTERKKAEEALRDSEERLRQSQKMEAVGQLAGGVAHDFNNLLGVIVGYTEMLLRRWQSSGDERTLHQLDEIKKAANRATSLTRQLLAFSRKQVLQPKTLDLNAVVNDMDKMLRRLIGEHIEMRTDLYAQLGSVKADPGQIEQVLLNLAVNARDAMPEGGSLVITTTNADVNADQTILPAKVEAGRYVKISVSDTGEGIPAEVQSRMFEPFFTTKEKGKGTGLGLSTVYGIVQQSGGTIVVQSEVRLGTTFDIYLPRTDEAVDQVQPQTEESEEPAGGETILLVEDEDTVRRLAHEILQSTGYSVLDASNGVEAVKVSERHPGVIDLMVTDVVMPQLGGRELAERLSGLRPDMRVLYMSGYTDDAFVHHGVLDGRAAFLQKPFTPDGLTRKIREVLAV